VRRQLARLAREYPDADCALVHATPFQLLVATILSAQCTDAAVNKVTPALFAAYPDAATLAQATVPEIEGLIRTIGLFRGKARNIHATARILVQRWHGEVPRTLAELVTLPGVARKTANVVLGTAFGLTEGMVVDTHILRLANRLGFAAAPDARRAERGLMERVPRARWIALGHQLILHGRSVCHARKPACESCKLAPDCPSAELGA
jgi:endonuclease-3